MPFKFGSDVLLIKLWIVTLSPKNKELHFIYFKFLFLRLEKFKTKLF